MELHLCYPSAQFLMEETQEAALGDSGWSREGRRPCCPWPEKENSLGALHRMKGQPCGMGSLLQPSAPCVKSLLSLTKGKGQGLEMPPNGYLSITQPQLPWPDQGRGCVKRASHQQSGEGWKVEEGSVLIFLSLIPKGNSLESAVLGRRLKPFELWRKQRTSFKTLPATGNSARLSSSPSRS